MGLFKRRRNKTLRYTCCATLVAGHGLPSALDLAVMHKRWDPKYVTEERLQAVFPGANKTTLLLDTIQTIHNETLQWQDQTLPRWGWEGHHENPWLGTGQNAIDPNKALFIGETEYDCPIAIDLRTNPAIVRWLAPTGNRWIKVADTVEDFIEALGLTTPETRS